MKIKFQKLEPLVYPFAYIFQQYFNCIFDLRYLNMKKVLHFHIVMFGINEDSQT